MEIQNWLFKIIALNVTQGRTVREIQKELPGYKKAYNIGPLACIIALFVCYLNIRLMSNLHCITLHYITCYHFYLDLHIGI